MVLRRPPEPAPFSRNFDADFGSSFGRIVSEYRQSTRNTNRWLLDERIGLKLTIDTSSARANKEQGSPSWSLGWMLTLLLVSI